MLLKISPQISQEKNNLDKKHCEQLETNIKLYYENQMNSQYKKDEKITKDIIRKNVKPANENDKME